MKNKLNIVVVLTSIFFFISCTKEIDLDLNTSDPQVVIEGNVTNNIGNSSIKISKSVNFDESNEFPKVENAIVTLTDNMGNSEILNETNPGYYTSSSHFGLSGRTYFLAVVTEGRTLTSFCAMPSQVSFDSVIVNEVIGGGGPGGGGPGGGGGSSTSYEVIVKYSDPAAEKNYYRFVEYLNGKQTGGYIFDDRLSNGLTLENALWRFNRKLNSGDTLKIEMQCIDKTVYEYFNSFGNLQGGPQNSSTPANPYTNIIGSKLGYFSAHTVEIRQVVIQ